MIELRNTAFDPAQILSNFSKQVAGTAGAVVSFTGLVRARAGEAAVTQLHLQAYSPLTERGIEDAADQARARWPLTALHIIHRTGDMAPGDPIVFVATASPHRRAAFEAADFLMDYLKTRAVFWKKETGPKGACWIEPRAEDYTDVARWDDTKAS